MATYQVDDGGSTCQIKARNLMHAAQIAREQIHDAFDACERTQRPAGHFGGIPVVRRRWGAVDGLPRPGTPCLVSSLVASAVPGWLGVYTPDTGETAIRDEDGRILAITRLVAA